MKKEKFIPADLGNLQDKAIAIKHAFEVYHSQRSPEMKAFYLKKAEQLADTLSHDIDYFMDTKEIGGLIPLGLNEIEV